MPETGIVEWVLFMQAGKLGSFTQDREHNYLWGLVFWLPQDMESQDMPKQMNGWAVTRSSWRYNWVGCCINLCMCLDL